MPLKYRQRMLEVEDGFVCDKCKQEYDSYHLDDAIRVEDVGSYNSQYWKDGTHWKFIICEKCSHELFSSFAEMKEYYE